MVNERKHRAHWPSSAFAACKVGVELAHDKCNTSGSEKCFAQVRIVLTDLLGHTLLTDLVSQILSTHLAGHILLNHLAGHILLTDLAGHIVFTDLVGHLFVQ